MLLMSCCQLIPPIYSLPAMPGHVCALLTPSCLCRRRLLQSGLAFASLAALGLSAGVLLAPDSLLPRESFRQLPTVIQQQMATMQQTAPAPPKVRCGANRQGPAASSRCCCTAGRAYAGQLCA